MFLGLMGSWFTLACLMAQAPSAGPASPPLKFPADLSNPRAALESFSFAAEGIRRNVRGSMIAALTMCDLPEGARQDEARTLVAMRAPIDTTVSRERCRRRSCADRAVSTVSSRPLPTL